MGRECTTLDFLTNCDAESALKLVFAVIEERAEDEGQRQRQQLLL